MSKILQALERHKGGAMPDDMATAIFTASLGKMAASNEVSQSEIKNLARELGLVTVDRDRLLEQVASFASVQTELGQLRERNGTLEESLKQQYAAVRLEQETLKRVTGESDERLAEVSQQISKLVDDVAQEKITSAALAGQIKEVKSRKPVPAPAPVVHPPNAPIDYSGMEFSVSSIVRGPDGIQDATIKLVKSN